MTVSKDDLEIGEWFEGVLLELFVPQKGSTRPRVRPVSDLPEGLRVEFPRDLRTATVIGTRFRADVKVCQKHNQDGSLRGGPYLRAETKSIRVVGTKSPQAGLRAVLKPGSISDRAYDYIFVEALPTNDPVLARLRDAAYDRAEMGAETRTVTSIQRERSEATKKYAHARANGQCEGCGKDAPFLSRKGIPFLEVHHLTALASGGVDTPVNVAALCPNCHRRVEHGEDGDSYNNEIRVLISQKEERH
jgi:hypothetical protein